MLQPLREAAREAALPGVGAAAGRREEEQAPHTRAGRREDRGQEAYGQVALGQWTAVTLCIIIYI
jgi:hypothetical protein